MIHNPPWARLTYFDALTLLPSSTVEANLFTATTFHLGNDQKHPTLDLSSVFDRHPAVWTISMTPIWYSSDESEIMECMGLLVELSSPSGDLISVICFLSEAGIWICLAWRILDGIGPLQFDRWSFYSFLLNGLPTFFFHTWRGSSHWAWRGTWLGHRTLHASSCIFM